MGVFFKRAISFFCILSLIVFSQPGALADETADLSGYWVSLEFGFISFTQIGNNFSAAWAGVTAAGTIEGNNASFAFWIGKSYETAKDDEKGHGTITVSDDGNSLTGQWNSADRKDPESGVFNAMRVGSIPAATAMPSPAAIASEPTLDTPGPAETSVPDIDIPAIPPEAATGSDAEVSALQGAFAEAYQAMLDLVNAIAGPFLDAGGDMPPEPEQAVPDADKPDEAMPPALDETLSDLYQTLVNWVNAITDPILSP